MFEAIALYVFLVILLALAAGWLSLAINGTKLRVSLGLYWYLDEAGRLHKTLFKPKHGPQTWARWHLFSIVGRRLDVCRPSAASVYWFYSRWGAFHVDVVFDRRAVLNVEKVN